MLSVSRQSQSRIVVLRLFQQGQVPGQCIGHSTSVKAVESHCCRLEHHGQHVVQSQLPRHEEEHHFSDANGSQPVWEGIVLSRARSSTVAPSFPTHGFGPSLAFHSAHVQVHSWMSSNQFAASIDVLPSHHPSKPNAPPILTSADHIVPQPHLAVISLLSSSPGPTRKLPKDVRGESVLHALFAIDRRNSKSSSV